MQHITILYDGETAPSLETKPNLVGVTLTYVACKGSEFADLSSSIYRLQCCMSGGLHATETLVHAKNPGRSPVHRPSAHQIVNSETAFTNFPRRMTQKAF